MSAVPSKAGLIKNIKQMSLKDFKSKTAVGIVLSVLGLISITYLGYLKDIYNYMKEYYPDMFGSTPQPTPQPMTLKPQNPLNPQPMTLNPEFVEAVNPEFVEAVNPEFVEAVKDKSFRDTFLEAFETVEKHLPKWMGNLMKYRVGMVVMLSVVALTPYLISLYRRRRRRMSEKRRKSRSSLHRLPKKRS